MTHPALQSAVRDDDLDRVRALAADPVARETPCPNGWTPLIVAAYEGRLEAMRVLLDAGARPDGANAKGTTPLMFAKGHFLRTGDAAPMRLLLARGADPEARDARNLRLIDYVPDNRRAEVAAVLAAPPL